MKIDQLAQINPLYLVGGVAVLGLLLWVIVKGPRGVAKGTAKATVDLVGGLVEGTVKGIGENIGVPDTSKTKCAAALAEGRYWDASFDCPAGDFIGGSVRNIFGIGAGANGNAG